MAWLTTKPHEAPSHEWRRRSLVRVRRPAWSDQPASGTSTSVRQANLPETSSSQTHTTHDDIAW
jgi:hypothetical protein